MKKDLSRISATQYVLSRKLNSLWGTECYNTRHSLPTLLYAGYSVKREKKYSKKKHLNTVFKVETSKFQVFLLHMLSRESWCNIYISDGLTSPLYRIHMYRPKIPYFIHRMFYSFTLYPAYSGMLVLRHSIPWGHRGIGAKNMAVNATGCGFDSYLRNWNIYSGVEVKRGVEFRHSTNNPEFSEKWGTD